METIAVVIATISSIVVILDWFGIRPHTMTGKQPTYLIMAVLLVLTWVAVGFDYHDRHSSRTISPEEWLQRAKHLTVVTGDLTGQIVVLDGRKFVDCTMGDNTFVYEGTGPTELKCSLATNTGNVHIVSNNPIVSQTMNIMKMFYDMAATGHGTLNCKPGNEGLDLSVPPQ